MRQAQIVTKTCRYCNKAFTLPQYLVKKKTTCSKKCRYDLVRGEKHFRWKKKITKKCKMCGVEMQLAPWEEKRIFCSLRCKGQFSSEFGNLKPKFEEKTALSYIIGVLIGDGYINKRKRVILDVTKIDFAISFFNALVKIGLNPSMRVIKRKNKNHNDKFRTEAASISFCKWYTSMSTEEIKNFIFSEGSPKELIRGFYESEGTLGDNLSFSNTNYSRILLINDALEKEGYRTSLHRSGSRRGKRRKDEYTLSVLGGIKEMKRFMKEIKPVIKNKLPERREQSEILKDLGKKEIEELYFNRELSVDEITKKLNVSEATFYRKIKKFNLPRRGHTFYKYAGRKKKTA